MRQSQRILAVVNDRALYQKISQLLNRSSFEVNRVPSGAGALILVGNLRYDLILVEAPLPDLELQDFAAAVRTLDSPCASSAVVVLAQNDQAAEINSSLIEDGFSVAHATQDPEALQSAVSQALGVAVRTAARLLVALKAELHDGSLQRMTQTANLSETGMLLAGAPTVPLGSMVELSFELPEDPKPIQARAEVVRHALPEVENTSGIGVRFTEMSAESATRLREFLRGRLSAQGEADSKSDDLDTDTDLDAAANSGA